MNRLKSRLNMVLLAVCLMVPGFAQAATPPKAFKLGMHMNKQGFMSAEVKRTVEMFLKEFEKQSGLHADLLFFNELSQLESAVGSGTLDFWYNAGNASDKLWNQTKYDPLLAGTLFGAVKHPFCMYVGVNSTAKTIADLKGKNVQTLDANFSYFQLRDALGGQPPEVYFNKLKFSPAGQSALMALSMGQTEGAFVIQFNVDILKMLNPGPLKKIRQLFCKPSIFPTPPLFAKKTLPKDIKDRLLKVIMELQVNPSFVRLNAMMKRLGIKWIHVTKATYAPSLQFMNNARKKGWEKDYENYRIY